MTYLTMCVDDHCAPNTLQDARGGPETCMESYQVRGEGKIIPNREEEASHVFSCLLSSMDGHDR